MQRKVLEALLVLLGVAVVARVAFGLLSPLLPILIALLVMVSIFGLVLRRR